MKIPPTRTRRPSPLKTALRALACTACAGGLVSCCPAPSTPPASAPCPPCQNQAEPQVAVQPTTQPAPAAGPENPGSCHDLVARAVEELESVERDSKSCARDADCVVVDRNTRCFDSCTTVISASGVSAYEQAKQRANRGPCTEFSTQGCTPNPPPPCTPPARPRCVAGSCGWYLPEG